MEDNIPLLDANKLIDETQKQDKKKCGACRSTLSRFFEALKIILQPENIIKEAKKHSMKTSVYIAGIIIGLILIANYPDNIPKTSHFTYSIFPALTVMHFALCCYAVFGHNLKASYRVPKFFVHAIAMFLAFLYTIKMSQKGNGDTGIHFGLHHMSYGLALLAFPMPSDGAVFLGLCGWAFALDEIVYYGELTGGSGRRSGGLDDIFAAHLIPFIIVMVIVTFIEQIIPVVRQTIRQMRRPLFRSSVSQLSYL